MANKKTWLQPFLFSFLLLTATPVGMLLFSLSAPVQAGDYHSGLQEAEAKVCFECHDDLASAPKGGHVHDPFSSGDCTACHELTKKNKFKLTESGDALCDLCHDAKNEKSSVHAPVASGDCVMCHNPHQSSYAALLITSPLSKLCFTCHEKNLTEHEFLHTPVAEGECSSCHDPHQSDHPKQLIEEGSGLCYVCHTDKQEEIKQKKHVHGAISMMGCMGWGASWGCHSPHGSGNKYQLLKSVPELCYDCHSDKQEEVKTPHGAMSEGKSCANCHNPHASDHPEILIAEKMELCLSCHSRKLKSPAGFIMNMKRWLKENPEHHVPVQDRNCTACHDPHGSNFWRILKQAFPPAFYTLFKVEAYSLCFGCHDEDLVVQKKTTSATGFRNGDLNLHSIHVSDGDKGRSCAACHDAHGTKGPKLVKKTAGFGKWQLPINLTLDQEGGTCDSGCHFPRGYNRSQAIDNP